MTLSRKTKELPRYYKPNVKMYYPGSAEREYYRVLRALARELVKITKQYLGEIKGTLRQDETETERIIRQIKEAIASGGAINEVDAAINRIIASVDSTIAANVRRAFKNCMGVDIFEGNSKLLDSVTAEWLAQQSQLANSIVGTYTDKLQTIISNAVQRGNSYADVAADIQNLYATTEQRAKFIARNEISNLNGIISKTRQEEAGIEIYQWSSSKDERVRAEHAFYDGKLFYWHETKAGELNGITVYPAPKYHPGMDYNCRCVALPVIDFEHWNMANATPLGEIKPNAATELKMEVSELLKVEPKQASEDVSERFLVNTEFVNAKRYHRLFRGLTKNNVFNEALYKKSIKILNHRNGTNFEDMAILDYKTGKTIVEQYNALNPNKVGLTVEQVQKVLESKGPLVVLHNHPASGRPSWPDIKVLLSYPNITRSVIVGHDGTIYMIYNIKRTVNIENIWNELYNRYINKSPNKVVAAHKALDALYAMHLFDYFILGGMSNENARKA